MEEGRNELKKNKKTGEWANENAREKKKKSKHTNER